MKSAERRLAAFAERLEPIQQCPTSGEEDEEQKESTDDDRTQAYRWVINAEQLTPTRQMVGKGTQKDDTSGYGDEATCSTHTCDDAPCECKKACERYDSRMCSYHMK